MAKNKGDLSISIKADSIKGTEIMSSGEYKYARVGAKLSDDEYISVSYEWKGSGVPDFVMAIMSFIQSNKDEIKEDKEELASLNKRLKNLEVK